MAFLCVYVPGPSFSHQVRKLELLERLPSQRACRLQAIDMVRGLVILIMGVDHVRDFFLLGSVQDPMGGSSHRAWVLS
jgi:uncharacterized membrane protein